VAQSGTQTPVVPPAPGRAARARPRRGLLAGGTAGNELLTAATGAILIVLLAIVGVTLLRLRSLLWVHLFVGSLLLGPVALALVPHFGVWIHSQGVFHDR
jgi:hypothetical protein